jgi:flavin reductase (DIM6/NTAB) family NADH-FMN oxidoreductase RutF
VTVVSCDYDEGVHGMTANAFASVSLDPPLVLVVVGHQARLHAYLEHTRRFGVSVLGHDQDGDGWHFAGRPVPARSGFARLEGVPVLDRGIAHLACDLWAAYPGGDHTIFIGRVTALRAGGDAPLVYYRGKFHRWTNGTFARTDEHAAAADPRPESEARR